MELTAGADVGGRLLARGASEDGLLGGELDTALGAEADNRCGLDFEG